jgi:hypothetical protein
MAGLSRKWTATAREPYTQVTLVAEWNSPHQGELQREVEDAEDVIKPIPP